MIISKTTFTTRQICTVGLTFSIFFSLIVLNQKDLINQDGILYVEVARLLQNVQFSDAIALYRWPFFPLLIAVVDHVIGIGLENSAYLLIVLFDALLLLAFILIVKDLGGDFRVQIAAMVVIFTLAYMNENRADIIRDHGYWACHLFSLLLYLKYYRSPSLWLGMGWSIVALLAALFRIEGFIVWIALPVIMLLRNDASVWVRIQHLFKSYILHIVFGIILATYLLVSDTAPLLTSVLEDLNKFLEGLLAGINVDMGRRIHALKTEVLDPGYSGQFAMQSFIGIILIILVNKILTAVSLPYVGIFLVRPLRSELRRLDSGQIRVIAWVCIIDLLVVMSYLIPKMFLSARWLVPLALVFLVFMPFMLVRALKNWEANKAYKRRRTTAIYLIFGLFILYGFLDGLISTSPSKSYVKESGIWIKQNLNKESKLYASHARIDYYSGRARRHSRYQRLEPNMWHEYDYLALHLKRNNTAWMNAITSRAGCLKEIKQFSGPYEAKVKIFRVIHDDGCGGKTK